VSSPSPSLLAVAFSADGKSVVVHCEEISGK
jgi:hypothetical protein